MALGLRPYGEVHALQRELRDARIAGERGDIFLMVEHPPVITLGRAHATPDLRAPRQAIERLGIDIVPTERGGDITYHGPGQLVGYGIIDLRARGLGVVDYVGGLERLIIDALGRFGIAAGTRPGARGVWTGPAKIASIGIAARRGVTMHGFALNVDPAMEHFDLINPCGLDGVEMTSMARELGAAPPPEAVAAEVVAAFERTFGWPLAVAEPVR
jgi:lipoic acid synthetase